MICLLQNPYLQDGIKAMIYLTPLIYLIAKKKKFQLKYFWLLFSGLLLLFFGHAIDFFDEFQSLESVFIIGDNYPLHDFFEDTIGFTLGFLLFIWGIYLELRNIN